MTLTNKNAAFQQIGMVLQRQKNATTDEHNVAATQTSMRIFQQGMRRPLNKIKLTPLDSKSPPFMANNYQKESHDL